MAFSASARSPRRRGTASRRRSATSGSAARRRPRARVQPHQRPRARRALRAARGEDVAIVMEVVSGVIARAATNTTSSSSPRTTSTACSGSPTAAWSTLILMDIETLDPHACPCSPGYDSRPCYIGVPSDPHGLSCVDLGASRPRAGSPSGTSSTTATAASRCSGAPSALARSASYAVRIVGGLRSEQVDGVRHTVAEPRPLAAAAIQARVRRERATSPRSSCTTRPRCAASSRPRAQRPVRARRRVVLTVSAVQPRRAPRPPVRDRRPRPVGAPHRRGQPSSSSIRRRPPRPGCCPRASSSAGGAAPPEPPSTASAASRAPPAAA